MNQSNPNSTLTYYDAHADEYASQTIGVVGLEPYYREFLGRLKAGDVILDLGCGSGRDLRYFAEQGFEAIGVEGSPKMARLAYLNSGRPVLIADFKNLPSSLRAKGIWAMASLLHVPRHSIVEVLCRVSSTLMPGGVLFASFKTGDQERTDAMGRHFADFNLHTLEQVVGMCPQLRLVRSFECEDTGRQGIRWVNIIARRTAMSEAELKWVKGEYYAGCVRQLENSIQYLNSVIQWSLALFTAVVGGVFAAGGLEKPGALIFLLGGILSLTHLGIRASKAYVNVIRFAILRRYIAAVAMNPNPPEESLDELRRKIEAYDENWACPLPLFRISTKVLFELGYCPLLGILAVLAGYSLARLLSGLIVLSLIVFAAAIVLEIVFGLVRNSYFRSVVIDDSAQQIA